MSGSLAPALVSSLSDLVEYHVEDASPVREDVPRGYAERVIHSELYKKYKDVRSVVHSHSEAVVPFSISSVPLRPVFHMGGVMGRYSSIVSSSTTNQTCNPDHISQAPKCPSSTSRSTTPRPTIGTTY